MIETVDSEWAANLPALFIVGAPRCGTTSLAGALTRHPKIAFSRPKEPHFFTQMGDPFDPKEVRRAYIARFFPHLSAQHRVLGEGSVSTLYDPDAVKRILRCFPQAKFIVMVRNPLQMLASYHGRVLFLLDEDQTDFKTAWGLQDQRAAGKRLPRACRDPNLLRYRDIGKVGAALERLFAVAGRERCRVVVYDDYARDSAAVLGEVLDFVGLRSDGPLDVPRRNVNRTYRYRWLQRLVRRPGKRMASTMLKAKQQESKAKPKLMLRLIRKLKRWNVVAAPRAPLDPDLRAELIATFADDVALLSRLIDRDLTPWLAGRSVEPERAAPGRRAAGR